MKAANDKKLTAKVTEGTPCGRCGGTGEIDMGKECPHCHEHIEETVRCPCCGGTGRIGAAWMLEMIEEQDT
jgi:RecJ-like exonuclease